MHWFLEHTTTAANYQSAKFGRVSARDPREGEKIILQLLFLTRRSLLRKIQGGL